MLSTEDDKTNEECYQPKIAQTSTINNAMYRRKHRLKPIKNAICQR